MADKRALTDKRLFLVIGILLLCLSPVFPQAPDLQAVQIMLDGNDPFRGQSFFIYRGGDEARFIQRLTWEEVAYAFRYVVIVERMELDGNYHEVERTSVYENFIEVSLDAGRYRFRIDVYDLLDDFAFSSDWQRFEIIAALQPELSGFSPQAFFLDEDDTWEIILRGENLLPESEFYLLRDTVRITPQRHISEGTSALLVFDIGSLIPGEYRIYIRNPGGLDTGMGTFTIAFSRPFDLNISLGYAPIIPLYGFLWNNFRVNNHTIEAPFPDSFYALGAVARINFIPFKRVWGNLGIDFSASLSMLEHEREHFTANAYFLNTHFSFLYQRYFFRRNFAFNLLLGAGITTLFDFHFSYPGGQQTESEVSHYASVIAGFSVKGFFVRPFFISAGMDFIHVFSPEGSMPGFIRPSVAVGVRL